MALILKQLNPDTIILQRRFASRLSGLIWFVAAGLLMFTFKAGDWIWLAVPCLLVGLHLLTYTLRIDIQLPRRDILWRRRFLFLFLAEKLVPFSGIRSVRIRKRRHLLNLLHFYFFLVDGSHLSISHSYHLNYFEKQGNALARIVGKPLVYEQFKDKRD